MPTEPPPWRTSTAVALCEAMRRSRNYSALPILADALEEAGYDNRPLLTAMRDPAYAPVGRGERLVAWVYSDESQAALKWLDNFAAALGLDTARLLDHAQGWLDYGSELTEPAEVTQCWFDYFEARKMTFWKNYALVTGQAVGPTKCGNFFACYDDGGYYDEDDPYSCAC